MDSLRNFDAGNRDPWDRQFSPEIPFAAKPFLVRRLPRETEIERKASLRQHLVDAVSSRFQVRELAEDEQATLCLLRAL